MKSNNKIGRISKAIFVGAALVIMAAGAALAKDDDKKVDVTKLSPEAQIDHEMIRDALDIEVLKNENLLPWEYNPIFYNEIFINCIRSLFSKEFAPLETRAKNAAERLKALPKLIKQAKFTRNIKSSTIIFINYSRFFVTNSLGNFIMT